MNTPCKCCKHDNDGSCKCDDCVHNSVDYFDPSGKCAKCVCDPRKHGICKKCVDYDHYMERKT